MATDSPRKATLPELAAAGTAVPLELFPSPPPRPARPRGAGDPALRPLVLAMASTYERKYGVPLAINWGREMKQAKRTLTLLAPLAGTLGTDPAALLAEAYDRFLDARDLSYQRLRHDTRLFWRDITRFTGEAVDRRRGIQALPAHQRPALLPESHRPRWMNRGATE